MLWLLIRCGDGASPVFLVALDPPPSVRNRTVGREHEHRWVFMFCALTLLIRPECYVKDR